MSVESPEPDRIEIVGRSDGESGSHLWGDVPQDQRLEWLRVASRNWPFFPGATVSGLTARTLREGHLVGSESLIRVARNAFEAGFTSDEYAQLRRLLCGRVPAGIVVACDRRPEHADHYVEIDAARCLGWLDRVRAGYDPELAMELFLAEIASQASAGVAAADCEPTDAPTDGTVEFGSGESSGDGWGVPHHGSEWSRGWWRVFEVYPPRGGVARTSTGKYARPEEGAAWEAALTTIARGLESAGFTPQDLYVLSLTLERLGDDQWARVDKRLFFGEGVHTRAGWMLAPVPEKWAEWPRLVHARGMLPHEATESVLGGVWRNGRF